MEPDELERRRSRRGRERPLAAEREIAEEVLDRMYSILEKYKLVTVADLYEILGETVNETARCVPSLRCRTVS